jgi:hypothetical protein
LVENYQSHELTAVSLNPVVPRPPERRIEDRTTTLLRAGKLIVGDEQQLCMIRNISSAGAMLKLWRPLATGDTVAVEITPDCPEPATVIWSQDDLAGVAFAKPIDVAQALRGGTREGPYRRIARTPRLRIQAPARLCTEASGWDVDLCEVSLNGARIETPELFFCDEEVTLAVDGLAKVPGRVRWCHDGFAGIEFARPLAMNVLADWVAASGSGSREVEPA